MNEFKLQINNIFTKYSKYNLMEINAKSYYIADTSSEIISYNIKDYMEEMVADILDIGKRIFEEDDLSPAGCAYFTGKYGVLNPKYTFNHNEIKYKNELKNGQSISDFKGIAIGFYLHFLSMNNTLPKDLSKKNQEFFGNTKETLGKNNLSYKLVETTPPVIALNISNLIQALYLGYTLAITDQKSPLKFCKNCKTIYYNKNQKSEFCSAKCRNYFNVGLFRGKNGQ